MMPRRAPRSAPPRNGLRLARWAWLAALVLLGPLAPRVAAAAESARGASVTSTTLGLTVRDGILLRDGRPYYGMGINYFNCLTRITGEEGRGHQPAKLASTQAGLRQLHAAGIPFIRFNAGGFYPVDWQLYQRDPQAWFAAFDTVVREAEQQQIGLIPSLFFAFSTIPDLVGEPQNQWGNPHSKTSAFMQRYTREVVTRYQHSPAIWGWEFSNEVLLAADLPGHKTEGKQGIVVPHWGTPAARTPADVFLRRDIYAAYRLFAAEIRTYDQTRPIFTGDSLTRSSAWHNIHEGSWTPDSRQQWSEVFLADSPAGIDTMTIHWYYWDEHDRQDVGPHGISFVDTLAFCNRISREIKKPLFVGECGGYDNLTDLPRKRAQMKTMMDAIIFNRIPLSAVWVFELENQPANSITATNEKGFLLQEIARVNRQLNPPPQP
jgi:hypothetical protein